MSRILLLAL